MILFLLFSVFLTCIFACLVSALLAFSFLALAIAWRSLRAGCLFSHGGVVMA